MGPWSKIDDLRQRVITSPMIEIDAQPIKTLEDAQAEITKKNFAPDRLVILGWEVLLSRRKQGDIVLWHLSVKLHPHGRPSSEEDWKVVGRIAARVGAPRDPVILPEDPHAAIHWSWIQQ
jgi:starvation-inducible outer membrane lipoprotein